jgi:trehalose/maltose hydrolase-like predicted phosphorylase
MARFNLEKSILIVNWARSERPEEWNKIAKRLELRDGEVLRWESVLRQLFLPSPDEHGIIEQFEGFFSLKEVPRSPHADLRVPIHRLYEWDEVNRSKIVKQADVLMLPFLFPEQFNKDLCAANFNYYEPITEHGSSLSPCVHAAVAFRAGQIEAALRYWNLSRNIDLQNLMKNTALGIHIGAIGGSWQTLVLHMLKVPYLPGGCESVDLKLRSGTELQSIRIQREAS